ncbi:MAG: GNAT family N-acetyltransferase [Clostridiales bacterium]|nr:GNAT family N-acetyltransferase [Clostridiales bacterium]
MPEEKNLSSRKYTNNQLKAQAIYQDMLEQLKKAISLKEDGFQIKSDAVMDMLSDELSNIVLKYENSVEKEGDINFDKSILPQKGMLLDEDEKVILKAVSDEDYSDYMKVSYECSIMKSAFKEETFKKDLWESFLEDTAANYSIFDKVTGEYVGYCGIKNLKAENWELAMELLKKYRYKGYGYHALVVMLNALTALTGKTIYRSRVDSDNYASQNLMKKLGARPNGISEMFIHGEELQKFQEENRNLIDDKLRTLADEFDVEPIDLIGHVLEFRIEWKPTN